MAELKFNAGKVDQDLSIKDTILNKMNNQMRDMSSKLSLAEN